MSPPQTRYAKSGEVSIAYQVSGSGPMDLVFVSNLDVYWKRPGYSDSDIFPPKRSDPETDILLSRRQGMARKKISGVYEICHVATGRRYVGQSYDIEARWRGHRRLLGSTDRHPSIYLQRVWKKYGESAFVFSVLEECSPDILVEREQFHMDATPHHLKLNRAPAAGSVRGIRYSEAERLKWKEAQKKRAADPAWREKISESAKARWANPEERRRVGAAIKKIMADPKERQRRSTSEKKRTADPEVRGRMKEIAQRLHANPAHKRKLSDGAKRRMAHPEEKRRLSERSKELWSDPKRRQQLEQTLRTVRADPEYRRRLSEAVKGGTSDPEYRRRLSERTRKQMSDPEVRRRASERAKEQMSDPASARIASETLKKLWSDPERRAKMLVALREGARRRRERERDEQARNKANAFSKAGPDQKA